MKAYRDVSGDSGVAAYSLDADSITVRFKTGATYLYTHASAGRKNVAQMKRLALAGRGLSTFISRHVSQRYATRLD